MYQELNSLAIAIENHIANGLSFRDISSIVQNYSGIDWIDHIDHQPTGLTRNKVYLSFNIEIFIMSWKAGYETLPHDHSKNGCWLRVLKGELIERLYSVSNQEENTNAVSEGQISFMANDIGYHSIKNDTDKTTYSIHIYSPSMHKTKYFSF